MLPRIARLTALLSAIALASAEAQAPGHAYVDDFGLSTPILAPSNSVIATYYGWEATTVFGHELFALTADQFGTDLGLGCFAFYSNYRNGCLGTTGTDFGGLLGLPLFGNELGGTAPGGKPLGVTCPDPGQACFGTPVSTDPFSWTAGTEIIFALAVYQGIDPTLGTPDINWFFSGDPTRNAIWDGGTGYAHVALWPDGVGGNKGQPPIVPGTLGVSLYGWEDVGYTSSDWDFDNAIFTIGPNEPGVPTTVVPEPATMALLGSGLAGLGLLGGRRRRRKLPAA